MVKAMMLLWIKMASHRSYFWIKMVSHHSYFAEFFLLSGYQGCFCRLPLSLKPEISFGCIRPKSANSSMRANSRTKGVRLTPICLSIFAMSSVSKRSADYGRALLQDAFFRSSNLVLLECRDVWSLWRVLEGVLSNETRSNWTSQVALQSHGLLPLRPDFRIRSIFL